MLTKHQTDNLLKKIQKHPELLEEYDRIISDYTLFLSNPFFQLSLSID